VVVVEVGAAGTAAAGHPTHQGRKEVAVKTRRTRRRRRKKTRALPSGSVVVVLSW